MTRYESGNDGAPLLSKWWQTESAQRAFARAAMSKAEKTAGLKERLAKAAERKAQLAREAMEWKEAA